MDNETFRVVAVAILAIAALISVTRGALLIKSGDKHAGSRFMLMGAALLMLTTVVLILQKG
ncbi:hypothetical protein [Aurantiacibacter aquimixticola]|uniref:Uncharacterized protein n=1 Tax=Aurantiacibacter aquimixticola TaxID=1958945 RepID=A0A419RU93_9SPHN|nr:hypothetical protein [Aurantiacibacter aquimixticola]RJY09361.1 hypothetical protein D6201_08335 [Aurantiacibacter aquimixticola]